MSDVDILSGIVLLSFYDFRVELFFALFSHQFLIDSGMLFLDIINTLGFHIENDVETASRSSKIDRTMRRLA